MKLFTERTSHWYSPSGQPCHSVPARTGQPRPTTLRDARRLGLLPSVTNVLGVINKPELATWKMEQAVLAALTLPRAENEDLDSFARRVVQDSQNHVQNAADFGTAFHAGAQAIATGQPLDPGSPAAAWLVYYQDWFRANVTRVHWAERVIVNAQLGYAGTADALIDHRLHGLVLLDIKTQGIKPPRPGAAPTPRIYTSWRYQLAAYRAPLGAPMRCMNLVVNSIAPEPPIEHLWSEEELSAAQCAFVAAHLLWCEEKQYRPTSSSN